MNRTIRHTPCFPVLFLCLTCGLLFLFPVLGGAEDEPRQFRTYSLLSDDVDAVRTVAETIIGKEGKVIYYESRHQFVIWATPEQHEKLAGVLEQFNVPPPMVRIVVQKREEAGRSRISGFGTSGSFSSSSQNLLVASGREGAILVGEQVPFRDWFVHHYGPGHGYFEEQITYRFVGARLVVQPTVLGAGGMIRLRLVPEFSVLKGGRREGIRITAAATEITVRNGQPFPLGGFSEHKEFYRHFLVIADRAGQTQQVSLTVTATIVET